MANGTNVIDEARMRPLGRRARYCLSAAALAVLACSNPVLARDVAVKVDARSAPWDTRINRKLAFGVGDARAPKMIWGARLVPGSTITFAANGSVSWITSGDRFGPNGDPAMVLDRSLALMPAHYITHAPRPVAMCALVGAFVNADGVVVGSPFAIGEKATVKVPEGGAAAIAIGVNDDRFADNEGEFDVQVHIPEAEVIVGDGGGE